MSEQESGIDTSRLGPYLTDILDVDVTGTEVLNDGLNLVIAVSTPTMSPAFVVRRPSKLRDTYYMNDLAGEYAVLEALRPTAVPAPEPVHYCDDPTVLGDAFTVTTYRPGSTVPFGTNLPERFRHPDIRRRLAEAFVDTLADLHEVDPEPFEPHCPTRTPRDQLSLALDRIDVIERATGLDHDRLRRTGEVLHDTAPAETEPTLVHGDYRPGNVLFAPGEDPELTGVLDWETALLGDPLVDLGYLLLRWGETPTVDLSPLETRFEDHPDLDEVRAMNDGPLAPFSMAPGSPSRHELVARYEARTGRQFDQPAFYRAFAAFSLALVWTDLHRDAIATGSESTGERDPYVDYAALLAEELCGTIS